MIRNYGTKNVIYGDDADGNIMEDNGLGWRFLKLDVDTCDFECLREWRLTGKEFDFSGFPKEHIIVITSTDDGLLGFVTREYSVLS